MADKAKRKGGAEKAREKKRKLLQLEAASCQKIDAILKRAAPGTGDEPKPSLSLNKNEDFDGVQPSTSKTIPPTELSASNQQQYSTSRNITQLVHSRSESSREPLFSETITGSIVSYFKLPEPPSTSEPSAQLSRSTPGSKEFDILHNEPVSEEPSLEPNLPLVDISSKSDETTPVYNYFIKPSASSLEFFFKFHPQQPLDIGNHNKIFFKNDVKRLWLTYDSNTKLFFCTMCLAFSKDRNSKFISGLELSSKHLYQRIHEHEVSMLHKISVDAYLTDLSCKSVDVLIDQSHRLRRNKLVEENREVMKRIIDVVKLIGKQCISYRGKRHEAAYNFNDSSVNHGNFIEIILLLSYYDPTLKNHTDRIIKKSEMLHAKGVKHGGNITTFLSKTTINYVIKACSDVIKNKLVEEIKKAKMFSIQMDSTQDISVKEQCSLVIRYVKDNEIKETLISVKPLHSTTGQSLVDYFKSEMAVLELDLKDCIGNSTDGASNMQGTYKGFSSLILKENPHQIHVWCYAHVLNLVIIESTSAVIEAASLFNMVNSCFKLLKDSHLRMNIWKDISKNRGVSLIGETRWWAKSAALKNIFGEYGSDKDNYSSLLISLLTILEDLVLKPETRAMAQSLTETLTSYEFIFTAHIFLLIFRYTTPTSNYLQSKHCNILQAYTMIEKTVEDLEKIQRSFLDVKKVVDDFIDRQTQYFETIDKEIEIPKNFKNKRFLKKKKLFSYESEDERNLSPEKYFELNIFNTIMDRTINTLKLRFSKHKNMYHSFHYFDPKFFPDVPIDKFDVSPLIEALKQFKHDITADQIKEELIDFINKWQNIRKAQFPNFNQSPAESKDTCDDSDSEEECASVTSSKDAECGNCAICVFKVLNKYHLYSQAYPSLHLCYQYILTLSVTQVSCERTFSKLKSIKTALRNSISDDKLESFLLMSTEREITSAIPYEVILEKLCESQPSLKKHFFV